MDSQGQKALTRHEAFAGILLAASASDGEIAQEELDSFCTTVGRMRMFSTWSGDRLVDLFRRLLDMIVEEGVDSVLDKCAKALPTDLRKTAFINACDMVMADGVVEEGEKEYINRLWKALEIKP